jgi:hypothetical protein
MSIYFDKNIFLSSSRLLPRRDRIKLFAVVLIQISLSLLDLAGVAIIGAIGALAVTGVQSRSPGNKVNALLKFFSLENSTLQYQVAILGIVAATVLILKTILSIIFS